MWRNIGEADEDDDDVDFLIFTKRLFSVLSRCSADDNYTCRNKLDLLMNRFKSCHKSQGFRITLV